MALDQAHVSPLIKFARNFNLIAHPNASNTTQKFHDVLVRNCIALTSDCNEVRTSCTNNHLITIF